MLHHGLLPFDTVGGKHGLDSFNLCRTVHVYLDNVAVMLSLWLHATMCCAVLGILGFGYP